MDAPVSRATPPGKAGRRLLCGAAVLALALYALLLALHIGAVAGGADSSGYMIHARLLASGHLHVQPRAIEGLPPTAAPPGLYVPLGLTPARDGDGMVPFYPSGLPVLVLLASAVAGWGRGFGIVMILHSLAGVVATYALGRVVGLGRGWSTVGAAIVAASPLYLFMSLQAMSDVPSLFWTTAAVLAALKSRGRMAWALAAGGAVALDVLVRPTNVLALVPVGIALGASPRRWLLLALGGLPGAVFLLAHSAAAFGSLVATGYGDSSDLFSPGFVPSTLLHYGRWLPVLFTPVVALVVGLPWLAGEKAGTRWLLGAWVAVFAAFYSLYQFTHEAWWYLRFLLPAAPAMVVGAMLVCRAILPRFPGRGGSRGAAVAVTVALAAVLANSILWSRSLDSLGIGRGELKYPLVCEWMRRNVPADAVCVAMQPTGALFFYTDFAIVRWDALNAGNVAQVERAIRSSGRPLYAVLFPHEIEELHALERRMPGHWIEVGNVDDVTIWRRAFDTSRLVLEGSPAKVGFAVVGPDELRVNPESGGLVAAAYGPANWWSLESNGADYWRWSRGDCSVTVHNPHPTALLADVSFGLATAESRGVTATANARVVWHGTLRPAYDNRATVAAIELPPGDTVISFRSDRPASALGGEDQRQFAFSIRNLTISLKGRVPPE